MNKKPTGLQRLSFKMAEVIAEESPEDIDKLAKLIYSLLPMSMEEDALYSEQLDAMMTETFVPKPPQPSPMKSLREAVHATGDMSLSCVINAAICKIKKLEQYENE